MDTSRPPLNSHTLPADFREFYWLKAELIAFCRENGLPTAGSKIEIADRIAAFLENGAIPSDNSRDRKQGEAIDPMPSELSRSTVVGRGWRCTGELRAFFVSEIGQEFHFNQAMRDFVKHGVGKTLQDGIDIWQADRAAPKAEKEIAPQFEYNRHMRAYYQAHPGATRAEALAAWNETRSQRKSQTE